MFPALSDAFLLIAKASREDSLDKFIEENDWAFILTHNFPNYKQSIDKPHEIAQNYLKELISQDNSSLTPILQSFNELKNSK